MGSRLRDMIRAVRACKTAAEERAVIAKECAALRTAFKEQESDNRHRNVAKLMFIHMLGYPTHFGQMECLKLIAAASFPEKRIGYLGLMLLLDERQEVLMLVTNSLKNDLNHSNQYIVGLALCAMGNICSAEMARDLAPEVEKLLSNSNSYIRKKAALCAIRILRKVPEMVEFLLGPATGLLSDRHHGVLIAGISLAIVLCNSSPVALEHYRKQTPTLVRILKSLVISGYAPEYDVAGITDPFLQVKVLRLLRLVGKGDAESSDLMSDILAQVATNTESNKNAGNAILYECVQTIMAVESISGLRVLAINILGRFLGNRDNNIRYVALNTLVKVVAVDTQAVQRHRQTIVECVKDSDVSIRRRALELVYALVNEHNVKTLTKELLEYLKVSDLEFKSDLTSKISSLVQRFAPSKQWHIDTMIRVMSEAGPYVKDEVCRSLVVLIMNAPELQGYTVRSLYRAFQTAYKGQESLANVTMWALGEYGEMLVCGAGELEGEEPTTVTESDIVDTLENVLKDVRSSNATKGYALVSLLKLSARFAALAPRCKALIAQYKGSLVLELQQRSCEFHGILAKHSNLKVHLADKMPALDETTYRAKGTDVSGQRGPASNPTSPTTAHANGPSTSSAQNNMLADLLDLSVDDTPAAPQSQSAGNMLLDLLSAPVPTAFTSPAPTTGGADMLLDLLSMPVDATPPAAAVTALPTALSKPVAPPPITLPKSASVLPSSASVANGVTSAPSVAPLAPLISVGPSTSSPTKLKDPLEGILQDLLKSSASDVSKSASAPLPVLLSASTPLSSSMPLSGSMPLPGTLSLSGSLLSSGSLPMPGSIAVSSSSSLSSSMPLSGSLALSGSLSGSLPLSGSMSMSGSMPMSGSLPLSASAPLQAAVPLSTAAPLLAAMSATSPLVGGLSILGNLGSSTLPAVPAPFPGMAFKPGFMPAGYPSIVALETSGGLKVVFDFIKPPGNPQTTIIWMTTTNSSNNPFTEFVFQVAVPKFMQLQLDPPSGSSLPPNNGGNITQKVTVTNSQHGQARQGEDGNCEEEHRELDGQRGRDASDVEMAKEWSDDLVASCAGMNS
ncbi:hypothetical protein CBR_g41578 [Chara braunii]|uniref:GAE domain-containing protein n=1 Tax=Chara braunii TaxID=69332 RepID=A0A388K2X3_CHABU|nr:hypothetical protein CBR_g41578 [Chara braunii]|eukprot:GBG64377.1 hypothetical protein CBR_g41578 [Chara braunii]